MDYTIASTDPKHFNRIKVNLPPPSWGYSNVTITSCVTNCSMILLKSGDYIDFTIDNNDYKLLITTNVTNLSSAQSFIATLPSISNSRDIPIEFIVNTDERISLTSDSEFTINNMSYNMKIVLGLYYNTKLPLCSKPIDTKHVFNIQAVGYFLSTPVLYLLSNLGGVNYFNLSNEPMKIDASSISMRLLNSFTASMPIIGANSEFSKIVLSTDLTEFELILVDANMHEVELLNPVYVTINITNASEFMTIEDLERHSFIRKKSQEEELLRLQLQKAKFSRINAEMNEEFELRFES